MFLNLDLYEDLFREFVILGVETPEIVSGFILSGRESVGGMKMFMKKIENIHFWNKLFYDSNRLQCPYYFVELRWDNDVKISTSLKDSNMEKVIQLGLNSVKRIEIDIKDPLPGEVVNLLLKNPNFTEIEIYHCDLSTIKILMESRKFDRVFIERSIFLNLNNTLIDTKELELYYVSLEDILKAGFIKMNSLILYSNEEVNDSLVAVDISPNLKSLERFELIMRDGDVFHNPQKILKFLGFLNTKLVNLKLLILDFNEFRPDLVYINEERSFNMSPNSFKNYVDYEEKLTIYNGQIKVKLNHYFDFRMISNSKEAVEDYLENLKKELRNFEYSYWIEGNDTFFNFKKSSQVKENFELNILVGLNHWLG